MVQPVEPKWMTLLKSRKLWAAVVSLIVALGFVENSGLDEKQVVEAILVIVTGISYVIGTAIEAREP